MPERYQVTEVLEPIRKVTLVAPARRVDPLASKSGWARSVRESAGDRAARPDRGGRPAQDGHGRAQREAGAAQEQQAPSRSTRHSSRRPRRGSSWPSSSSIAAPRAPFSGRVVGAAVCTGQYVFKGTIDRRAGRCHRASRRCSRSTAGAWPRLVADGARRGAGGLGQGAGDPAAARGVRGPARAGHAVRAPRWSSSPIPRESSSRACGSQPDAFRSTPIATVPKRAVKPEDAAAART